MNKKICSVLSVIALMTLVSCAKTADNDGDRSFDGITLRLMAYNSESSRATYLKYLEDSLPGVEIIYEFVSLDNFSNVLNAQLLAGQGPDIIEVGGDAKLLAKAGYLWNITNQQFVEKYTESGIAAFTVNGNVYATPMQSWFEGIFYNKKIFRENDVTIPKTFDQFIQLHKDLNAKGIKPQTMGARSWEPMMKQSIGIVNNEFYAKAAGRDFDEKFDNGEAKLAEAWLPSVSEWYRMIEENCLTPDMLGLSHEQALDEFASGKAAMWECGPWDVNAIMEKNPDFELGMFPIPGLTEGVGWLVGGPGSGLAVNKASHNAIPALKVLDMTATPEAQAALIKDNAGSSFLIGADADLGGIYADCAEALRLGYVYAPWVSAWTAGNPIVEGYGKALQEVLAGTKTVEQALKDADVINDTMRFAFEN
ncbi:MAG: extracellular solute-binding protein [Oscillospiraceae bacterium]|nr:extracellular solute-binding protein [Oscillospiraceae bacterium]